MDKNFRKKPKSTLILTNNQQHKMLMKMQNGIKCTVTKMIKQNA